VFRSQSGQAPAPQRTGAAHDGHSAIDLQSGRNNDREGGCRIMIASDERAGEQERLYNVRIRERGEQAGFHLSIYCPCPAVSPCRPMSPCACAIFSRRHPLQITPPLQFRGQGSCPLVGLLIQL